MEIEYLIIYQNNGIPIYSRCFANACKMAMSNDVLFSAFLASLNTFARNDPDNMPKELDLNNIPVKVNFDASDGSNSITLEELELIFFYAEFEDITIATGFDVTKYERSTGRSILKTFFTEVEAFLRDYKGKNWGIQLTEDLISFEEDLFARVLHPFFDMNNIKQKCPLGDNCPFRVAIYENDDQSIFDRLRKTVERYAKMNVLQKMKHAIFKSKYPLNMT